MDRYKLLKLSSLFNKRIIKKSSLTTDMAHRIMYSALTPYMKQDDINLLELSVSGADKLIKYGTAACANEAKHDDKKGIYFDLPIFENIIIRKNDSKYAQETNINLKDITKENIDNVIELQRIILEHFISGHFQPMFAGKGWINIIKILINLTQAYKDYINHKYSGLDYINNMKHILYLMNVFDGTAHNTGSIYSKLIVLENPYVDSNAVSTNLDNMMNSKELGNEKDVFDQVFKHLDRIAPYTEYFHQIRDKDYFIKSDNFVGELFWINAKKQAFITISRFISDAAFKAYYTENSLYNVLLQETKYLSINLIRYSFRSIPEGNRNTKMLKKLANSIQPIVDECIKMVPDIVNIILAAEKEVPTDDIGSRVKRKNIVENELIPYENILKDKIIEVFSKIEVEPDDNDGTTPILLCNNVSKKYQRCVLPLGHKGPHIDFKEQTWENEADIPEKIEDNNICNLPLNPGWGKLSKKCVLPKGHSGDHSAGK